MLHLHFLIKRKEGLSRKEFSDHWRNVHAPLAMQIPGVRRYVQNHTMPFVSKNPSHDGIVELWMDSREAVKAAFNSPAYREEAYVDEPNFVDIKNVTRLQTEDHVMLEGPTISKDADLIKRVSFIKRKPGMSREDFSQYWLDVHGPLALQMPGISRYVQCHVAPEVYEKGEPAYDGVAQIWFETMADMQYAMNSQEYKEGAQPDGPKFVDPEHLVHLLTEENRVVWP
jgi:uncharacterized protein (TIGR02118 family)